MFGGGWLVFEKGEFEVFFPLGKEKRQDKGDPRGGGIENNKGRLTRTTSNLYKWMDQKCCCTLVMSRFN